MKKTNFWAVVFSVLLVSTITINSYASDLEDCARHYHQKAKFLEKFLWGGFAGTGGGALAGLAAKSITTFGAVTVAGAAVFIPTLHKYDRHLEFSQALLFLEPDIEATEEEEKAWRSSFYTFQRRVNKKLDEDERLYGHEFSEMLTEIVKAGAICQTERVITTNKKGIKKEKYQGWIMKPKKVRNLMRRRARALAGE